MEISQEEMKELVFVHLHEAIFCANCELIANRSHAGMCPACGSKAILSVSRLLGGTAMAGEETAVPSDLVTREMALHSPVKAPTMV